MKATAEYCNRYTGIQLDEKAELERRAISIDNISKSPARTEYLGYLVASRDARPMDANYSATKDQFGSKKRRVPGFKLCMLAIFGLGYLAYQNSGKYAHYTNVARRGVSSPQAQPASDSGCNPIKTDTQSADSFDWLSVSIF